MKHIPYWIGAATLFLLLGAIGEDDYRHQVADTAHVEHIMEMAKQEELARREDAWFNLYQESARLLPEMAVK